MLDAELDRMFNVIAKLGESYDMVLPGHDGLIAFEDFRVADIEVVTHEFVHFALAGMDLYSTEPQVAFLKVSRDRTVEEEAYDEITTMAISIVILGRLGIAEVDPGMFADAYIDFGDNIRMWEKDWTKPVPRPKAKAWLAKKFKELGGTAQAHEIADKVIERYKKAGL